MKKLISFKFATQLSLVLFGLFILSHFSIVVGIIVFNYVPIDYLWGGRMETKEQLLVFEIISMVVMIVCFFVVLIRSEKLKFPRLIGASKVMLWILTFLFLFNTIGNISAKSQFEKFFAIFTISFAILCLRLALGKK